MKILRKIIIGIVIFLIIVYGLPATLLQIPYFQEKTSHQIASYLTKKLQTEVHIRQIELEFFNKLILRDVHFEDLSGEVLFQAKRIAAGFEFAPLLRNKWRFNSVQLFTFNLNLSKETDDSPLNIKYIIDAFVKQDTVKTKPNVDLRIKNLSLRSGSLSFRVKDKVETPGIFNPEHFSLYDISSKIQIHNLSNNELSLQINRLHFKEQSGLQMKNLTFDLTADEEESKIERLVIELGESSFLFSDISANYNLSTLYENKPEPVSFKLKLDSSTIYPKELGAIIPAFLHFDERINLNGDFTGTGNDLSVKNLYFRYNNQMMINANADLKNFFNFNLNKLSVKGNIKNSFFSTDGVEHLVNNFSEQPFEFPKQIRQLGNIHFEGDINGSFNNLFARGVWDTNLGIIHTNITLGKNETRFLKGSITSESLNMEKLLSNSDYGEMAFDISLDAKQDADRKFFGAIDANIAQLVYKGYTYHNLSLNGNFSPTSFEGNMNLSSPEGRISGKGLWVINGKDSKFDFSAKISNLQLDKMNLTKKYKDPLLSFELSADLTGNNPDNLTGFVSLKNLLFETNSGSYSLDSLKVISTQPDQEKHIRIDSEILSGEIKGNYSYKTIVPTLKQTFANYLPALVKPDLKYSLDDNTDFSAHFTMSDLTDFSMVFELPFSLQGQTDISGRYNGDELYVKFTTPQAVAYGLQVDSLQLVFNSSEKDAQVDISGISVQKRDITVKFDVRMDAINDKINTSLHWGNGSPNYGGDLKLSSLFSKNDGRSPIRVETDILQTNMIFNDSIWTFYPAKVIVDSSDIQVSNIHAAHRDQFLKINGTVSKNPDEELKVDLNKIDLEYIFQSLDIPALEFGGMTTGFVNVQDVFHTRKLEAKLDIRDFTFNTVNFGNIDLIGTWDDENQGVLMKGKAIKNDSTFVDVDGIIYPVKEEISINFDAENADARFLRKYLDKVVQEVTGNLSGHLRLFGRLTNPTVEGDVFAQNCRFGIEYLNTFYTFTDSVKCLPDTIKINNIGIYDEKGNRATASGFVKHNVFKDFIFSASVSFTDFMIFNATKSMNPMFYGTAFGTGTASLFGNEDELNINVITENTGNTRMSLNFMEETDIEEYNFIRFVSTKNTFPDQTKKQEAISNPVSAGDNGPEIRFNLTLNATPQATIELVMDPVSGDKISGYGNGNLQIQYGTKTPLKVLGNYVIEKGKYNFSLQQFLHRDFEIQEGSSVAFRGNPFIAELDIKANCIVNANLEDLDRQLIENKNSARNNVQVSCILQLNGPLDHPGIAFDLDLPGATDELIRQVKSYIRTEDMMNRQIAYLLVLSRFYTSPENMRDNSAINNSNWSYLTSTLSSQISNMLGLLSDNFQLGTIFHQSTAGTQTSTEFELLLSSQLLNNRLLVNGNFGYINNPLINGNQNSIPLIGDFDLEYKLTKSGDIRLKGFNHYNFRNYYSITPEMTQGIGVLYRKDFNHWLDLVKKKNVGAQ